MDWPFPGLHTHGPPMEATRACACCSRPWSIRASVSEDTYGSLGILRRTPTGPAPSDWLSCGGSCPATPRAPTTVTRLRLRVRRTTRLPRNHRERQTRRPLYLAQAGVRPGCTSDCDSAEREHGRELALCWSSPGRAYPPPIQGWASDDTAPTRGVACAPPLWSGQVRVVFQTLTLLLITDRTWRRRRRARGREAALRSDLSDFQRKLTGSP